VAYKIKEYSAFYSFRASIYTDKILYNMFVYVKNGSANSHASKKKLHILHHCVRDSKVKSFG